MTAELMGWDLDGRDRGALSHDATSHDATAYDATALDAMVQQARRGVCVHDRRTVGTCRRVSPGARAYLMLEGRTRGLVGHGVVGSSPFTANGFARPGMPVRYVLVDWDLLLSVDDRIPPEELAALVPSFPWGEAYGPALLLPGEAEEQIERMWADRAGLRVTAGPPVRG